MEFETLNRYGVAVFSELEELKDVILSSLAPLREYSMRTLPYKFPVSIESVHGWYSEEYENLVTEGYYEITRFKKGGKESSFVLKSVEDSGIENIGVYKSFKISFPTSFMGLTKAEIVSILQEYVQEFVKEQNSLSELVGK